nr:MAG: glycoprotein [Lantra virus]
MILIVLLLATELKGYILPIEESFFPVSEDIVELSESFCDGVSNRSENSTWIKSSFLSRVPLDPQEIVLQGWSCRKIKIIKRCSTSFFGLESRTKEEVILTITDEECMKEIQKYRDLETVSSTDSFYRCSWLTDIVEEATVIDVKLEAYNFSKNKNSLNSEDFVDPICLSSVCHSQNREKIWIPFENYQERCFDKNQIKIIIQVRGNTREAAKKTKSERESIDKNVDPKDVYLFSSYYKSQTFENVCKTKFCGETIFILNKKEVLSLDLFENPNFVLHKNYEEGKIIDCSDSSHLISFPSEPIHTGLLIDNLIKDEHEEKCRESLSKLILETGMTFSDQYNLKPPRPGSFLFPIYRNQVWTLYRGHFVNVNLSDIFVKIVYKNESWKGYVTFRNNSILSVFNLAVIKPSLNRGIYISDFGDIIVYSRIIDPLLVNKRISNEDEVIRKKVLISRIIHRSSLLRTAMRKKNLLDDNQEVSEMEVTEFDLIKEKYHNIISNIKNSILTIAGLIIMVLSIMFVLFIMERMRKSDPLNNIEPLII